MQKSHLTTAIASIIGISSAALPGASMSATLLDGYYDMIINNACVPFCTYTIGIDGAWESSFTFGALPGSTSNALYDDTIAQPVNGKYSGVANDGVAGTIGISVVNGLITGTGKFEFDTIPGTAGGDFAEYGGSSAFTGSIDASGNITLTTTGALGTVSGFPALVDEAWNVDNFNGVCGTVACAPNSNTTYDTFSTGSATNSIGTINGAAFDGTTAILVKGGTVGADWGGFFGAQYFEVWNVDFNCDFPGGACYYAPVPAAVWLFGSGLLGLIGIARRKKI